MNSLIPKLALLAGTTLSLFSSSAVWARSSYFNWTSSGYCYEYTPNGSAIQSASLNVCRREVGSFYNWTNSGYCYEYTPNGAAIRSVNSNTCREAVGSYYNWTNSGYCYEYTPNGAAIRSVNSNTCREVVGSYYRWTNSGYCYEYTPTGAAIRSVHLDRCRNSSDILIGGNRPQPHEPGRVSTPIRSFKHVSLQVAKRVIAIASIFEDYVNAEDYIETILPLKKQAGLLEARVSGRAEFIRLRNTLIHMGTLLSQAESFIEDNMERSALFEASKELLTMREKVRSLIDVMDDHKGSNDLY